MSRTISQLDLGTSVYVSESGADVEYILIKKDVEGCILLRAQALGARRINPTNVSVYENSEMDQWLTNEETGYMSLFNTATKNAIVSRSRPTYNYGDSECRWISRRAFLLTQGEMFGSTPTALEPLTSLVPALYIWKGTENANTARICKNAAGKAVYWWLSSPYSATHVFDVHTVGSLANSIASYTGDWARPALNVASATIVSDEGADIIRLAPTQDYRELSFEAEIATSDFRPYKINLKYDTTNLYDISVQVCNNFGDENPVWVTCTSGVTVDITNTVKQTADWKIGVKFYAKSQSLGWVEEPIIKWLEVA